MILAKKDHIEGLGPVPLMGLGPVWLIPVLLRCVIDPSEEKSYLGVGSGPILELGPVPFRGWNQSHYGVGTGPAEGLGPFWLGPVPLRCWN